MTTLTEILAEFSLNYLSEYRWKKDRINNLSAEDFLKEKFIDFAKGCVPTKDTTPDADEYERADRMAFNACCQQMQKNIERNGK